MKTMLAVVAVAVVGVAVAEPAEAGQKNKRRAPAVATTQVAAWDGYVDARLGPFGPNNSVIFSNRVIGVDPDPNIRAAILKDISGYFGGGR
jgi:hypothetical protein